MDWQQIRERYPYRWVVVEAINAHTKGTERIIKSLEIIGVFWQDWRPAWECYKYVHAADKTREYYVLHTRRRELNIGVLDAFGRAVSRTKS